MSKSKIFDYEKAFCRNVGWLTPWEQQILRYKRVAIAGAGGVGGIHLLTLVRLGIQKFHIADFDSYELANFNRQAGAMMSTLGVDKVDVMEKMALDINPQIEIKKFSQGVIKENVDEFLKDVDIYIDGLDAFALDARKFVFERCHQLGIPAVTAAPIGFGVAYLIFMPGQMSFEEYFRLDGRNIEQQKVNFFLGLNPEYIPSGYIMDSTTINVRDSIAPSTSMACQLAAGATGTQVVKVLLKRGKIYPAPYYHFFDPYVNTWILDRLSGGNNNFFHTIKRWVIYQAYSRRKMRSQVWKDDSLYYDGQNVMACVLDLARWTPSGDNAQPWEFEICSEDSALIHFRPEGSIYDYSFVPSRITVGMFVETLKIAASRFERDVQWNFIPGEKGKCQIEVKLTKSATRENKLCSFVKIRSVDRNSYRLKDLGAENKKILNESINPDYQLIWYESLSERMALTDIVCLATDVRLRIPEAYQTHKHLLDYNNKFSVDRIPAVTAGTSSFTRVLAEWALQDWNRLHFLNKYFGGSLMPTIEASLIPGIFCSAYFILALQKQADINHNDLALINAGENVQRFWLTVTSLGLVMQPCIAALAVANYAHNDIPYTKDLKMLKKSKIVAQKMNKLAPVNSIVFIGRVGYPKNLFVPSRSVRKPLADLMIQK